jgi:hypothetical protein
VPDLVLFPWNADDAANVEEIEWDGWCRVFPTVLLLRNIESESAVGGPSDDPDRFGAAPKPTEDGPRGWRIIDASGVFDMVEQGCTSAA